MPKVLILVGNDFATWYYGKGGETYQATGKDGDYYEVGPLLKRVHKNHCLFYYTEAEYKEVLQQRDKAIDDLAKHAGEMAQLRRELGELRDGKKVELPQDVAIAIESFRDNGWNSEDIFLISENPDDGEWAATLYKWKRSSASAGRNLMIALANGYTIEQSPEEMLQQEIEDLIQEWWFSPTVAEKDIAVAAKELAGKIVENAKQFT